MFRTSDAILTSKRDVVRCVSREQSITRAAGRRVERVPCLERNRNMRLGVFSCSSRHCDVNTKIERGKKKIRATNTINYNLYRRIRGTSQTGDNLYHSALPYVSALSARVVCVCVYGVCCIQFTLCLNGSTTITLHTVHCAVSVDRSPIRCTRSAVESSSVTCAERQSYLRRGHCTRLKWIFQQASIRS